MTRIVFRLPASFTSSDVLHLRHILNRHIDKWMVDGVMSALERNDFYGYSTVDESQAIELASDLEQFGCQPEISFS